MTSTWNKTKCQGLLKFYTFGAFNIFSAIQIFDFDYALLSGELDIDKFVSLSSDIMLVEMIHRVFVSSYEVGLPVCIYKCIGQFLSCFHVKVK